MATGSFRVSTKRHSASRRTIGLDAPKANSLQFLRDGPDVVRMMAGPNVWICDECVRLCCDAFWPDEVFPWSPPTGPGAGH